MTTPPDDVSRLDPVKRIGEEQKQTPTPGQQSFESYMEKASQQPGATAQPSGMSPFELAKGQTPLAAGPTLENLLGQVKSAHTMLGDINNQLQTKNLKLKQSQRYLLRNKLSDANSYLRAANTKMGAEVPPPPTPSGGGMMGKFFDMVSEGQTNLQSAQKQIQVIKDKGASMNGADFIAVQVKLAHAQQEIEYASIMLSTAVQDMKTLFNIQL